MDTAPITHLVRRLEQADTSRLDEAAARAALADVARVRNWAVAVRASLVQRLDALGEAAASPPAGGGPPGSGDASGGDAAPSSEAPGAAAAPCPKPAELELADTGRVSEREAAREAFFQVIDRIPGSELSACAPSVGLLR